MPSPTRADRSRVKERNLSYEEKATILAMRDGGHAAEAIAKTLGRSPSTIQRFLATMVDSVPLAKATLRAGAARLAERVIKKAEVKEAIDVLSRTDIGVLAPIQNKGVGGFGIQVSVAATSCGTVVRVEGGTTNELPAAQPAIEGQVTQAAEVPRVEG